MSICFVISIAVSGFGGGSCLMSTGQLSTHLKCGKLVYFYTFVR